MAEWVTTALAIGGPIVSMIVGAALGRQAGASAAANAIYAPRETALPAPRETPIHQLGQTPCAPACSEGDRLDAIERRVELEGQRAQAFREAVLAGMAEIRTMISERTRRGGGGRREGDDRGST